MKNTTLFSRWVDGKTRLLAKIVLMCAALAALPQFSLADTAEKDAAQNAAPQLNLPRIHIQAGMYRIDAQMALTPEQRQKGLMFRRDMPQHEGMLFVFSQPAMQCFWMKNTLIPLSAAFVADDGTIVNIVDMQAQSQESHCSEKPVRFVLEMNKGWFADKGMSAGFKLQHKVFRP